MHAKKWIKLCLLFIVFTIMIIIVFNYIVDPFQQYRVKTFYKVSYSQDKERYKNAGFAKNYEYDSVIVGTSMTENFIISETQNILGYKKSIKLCTAGGSAREQSVIMETAIINNKNIKNILWGLDVFAFFGEQKRLENTFPIYLYDQNVFNDYKYLMSIDTLKESFKELSYQFVKPKDSIIFKYNLMYQWQHHQEKNFTLEHFLESWINRDKNLIEYDQKFSFLKNNFDLNFVKIIKDNPQINFKIFFPPYSILYFKSLEEKKLLKDTLEFKKYIFQVIGNFNNVEIYDFYIASKVTNDFSNYRELMHYHQKINTWILKEIKNNNYLVTKDNFDKYEKKLRKQINDYNISGIGN